MKKSIKTAAIVVALVLAAGTATVIATNQGSQQDPLVTLSYLNQTVLPTLEAQVDQAVKANEKELSSQLDIAITSYEHRVDETLAAAGAVFVRRELASGQSYTADAGHELLLVSGKAVAVGALTDTTAGTAVSAGASLTVGHLYITTQADSGFKATAAAVLMGR